MGNQAKREMTLDQWVGGLPEGHGARVELTALKRENEAIKNLVVGRVNGEWPDGFDNEPDDWEEWSLQLYGHEAGDLLLGQEAWDHIVRGLKRAFLLTEEFTGGTTPTYFSAQDRE